MTIRWMSARAQSIALLVSLAVNLLLVSAIVTYAVRGHDRGGRDRMAAGIERMAGRLPEADATRLRAAYQAHVDEFRAAREDIRRLREAVRAALHAEPFDPKALDQATENLARRQEVQGTIPFPHLTEPRLSDPIGTHRFPLLRHCKRSRPSERVWQSLFTNPRLLRHVVPRKDNLFNALHP